MKKRILIISLAVTLAALLLFSFAATQVYYDGYTEQAREYLETYAAQFDGDEYALDNSGAASFSADLNGARVTLMDADGMVLGESDADDIQTDHSDRPEVMSAIATGSGFAIRKSDTLGKKMMYYCLKVAVNGTNCLVRVASPISSEWAMFVQALPTIAVFLAIDVLLCLAFAFVATRFILDPVEKLTREATLGNEVDTGYSELKPLAALLNERNKSLAFQMEALNNEKELVIKTQNSKDELISNITHEMNTPLTSIKGYAELLESGALNEEQTRLAYKTIYSQSERLTNLIACIINYNEIDNDDLPDYEVDFSAVARDIVTAVLPEAEKAGVSITSNIEDGVKVMCRHERVSELAGNLIRNAIRYNKAGGSVTVTLNAEMFRVADTGVGIAEENMEKIFSRFFTVDKSHSGKNGGFGLGLAVCKRICKRAGWTISVDSKLGEGSVFTVKF